MTTVNVQPTDVLNLRRAVGLGLYSAVFRIAADFLAGENKDWTYYAGVLSGATVAATGIDGATASLAVIASSVKAQVLRNPNGGEIEVFIDGVLQGTIDLYAAQEAWELVEIFVDPVATAVRNIELRNNVAGAAAYSWMALGLFELTRLNGTPIYQERTPIMAYNAVAFRIKDAETDTRESSMAIYLPTGLTIAQYQAWVDAVAPEVDALTDGEITSVELTLTLTLPAGLKPSPVAGSLNERGGLITFDTTGPRADSVRIPAFNRTIMPGAEFSLTDTDVAAFITRLTTATTAANIRPRTSQDYQFEAARKGVKSLRK